MRLRMFIFLCPFFLLLTAWGHWGPQVKIGVSLDQTQGRETLIQSLKEELEENHADFLLQDAKGNPATQEEQVKDLIRQGIQALIVLPADPQKAAHIVQAAHQAGIKVISLESFIPNSGLDYLIGFDDHKAGELQARALVKKVPSGVYVFLDGDERFGFSRVIGDGQTKVLQPLIDRGDIQIRGAGPSDLNKSAETTKEWAKGMTALLKTQKNKVNAILTSDSKAAEGAAIALSKAGLSGKVQVAGIGEDLGTCQRIASGTQTLTIYYPPKKLAEETAYLAAKVARKATQFDCQFTELDNGGSKTLAVLLTPMVVDAKNLDSTIIKDGVQKREEVYSGKP